MPFAQRQHRIVDRLLPLGLRDQRQQRIGDAAARRQHDAEALAFVVVDDVGDALDAGRVGDTRSPELMDPPPVHQRVPDCKEMLTGEAVDDVDELGEAFGVFVAALRDAVGNTLFDVKFEDDMADAPDRRLRSR